MYVPPWQHLLIFVSTSPFEIGLISLSLHLLLERTVLPVSTCLESWIWPNVTRVGACALVWWNLDSQCCEVQPVAHTLEPDARLQPPALVSLSGSLCQFKLTSRQIVSSPHGIALPFHKPLFPGYLYPPPILPLPLCTTTRISSHETSMWNVVGRLRLTPCHSLRSFLCLLYQTSCFTCAALSPHLCSLYKLWQSVIPSSRRMISPGGSLIETYAWGFMCR